MAHCLSEWTEKKHSGIVQSSERTPAFLFPEQRGLQRSPQRDVCDQQAKIWPTGAWNILLNSKEANFVLLHMRCNLLGEMFGFMCQIMESQIWGSLGISEEKVSNHKLIQQGNKVTKEMFHCA